MSKFFIRKFKRAHKCSHCSADKLSGYSLCPEHLEQARQKWESWAVERRAAGLCCYCDCKSFRGWLRCRMHAEINRLRCKAWFKEHPERSAQYWKERVKQYKDKGRCAYCKPHRKLAKNSVNKCKVCLVRSNLTPKIGFLATRAVIRTLFGTDT